MLDINPMSQNVRVMLRMSMRDALYWVFGLQPIQNVSIYIVD